MKPRIRKPLRKGSLVYHGTSSEDEFIDLNGPAWVSDAETVARWFVGWAGGKGSPRVLVFRVTSSPTLVVVDPDDDDEFRRFTRWVEERTGQDSGGGIYDLASLLCELGVDGWHFPKNYPGGSDTMLCDPDRFLEHIETIEVRR